MIIQNPKYFSINDCSRINAALLVAFIYAQDIFWFICSRLVFDRSNSFFLISELDIVTVSKFIILCLFFSGLSIGCAAISVPVLPKISLSRKILNLLFLVTLIVNSFAIFALQGNLRYVSGGLTGFSGFIYVLSQSLTLFSIVVILRDKFMHQKIAVKWMWLILLSSALTIDGLAAALFLLTFVFLYFNVKIQLSFRLILSLAIALIFLGIGFSAKFSSLPDYLDASFFSNWVIARFSIQAEQAYKFLHGESIIGSRFNYYDILLDSIANRFALIFSGVNNFDFPKSLSEALLYDMTMSDRGGSSPGLFLNTLMTGPLFFILPVAIYFLFFQFFYGMNFRFGFLSVICYSFLFKGLHANFSEYIIILSPSLMLLFFYLFATVVSIEELCSDE